MNTAELKKLKKYLTNNTTKFEKFVVDTLIYNSDRYDSMPNLLNDCLILENGIISELISNYDIIHTYNKYDSDIHSIIADNYDVTTLIFTDDIFGDITSFKTNCLYIAWEAVIKSITSFLFDK